MNPDRKTTLSLGIDLDAENPGHMLALANFASSLASCASGGAVTYATPGDDIPAPAVETGVASDDAGQPAPADKPAEAKEEKPAKRRRRNKAQIEADNIGKEANAPAREDDESAEDYLERIAEYLDDEDDSEETGSAKGEAPEDEDDYDFGEDGDETEATVTIDDIRSEMAKHMPDKKKQIKKEFDKLGAKKVSDIEGSDRTGFLKFLQGLAK